MRHKAGLTITASLAALALLLWTSPSRAQERFSLSMFHFNVQYVAGGLVGFPDGETHMGGFDLDDAELQDVIIVESFEPVLDLLIAHPTWKLTLELQGHMVEAMQARHSLVLDKLRTLVDDGQVELVSFHYSDQLFLAYPRLDLVRSQEILDEVLADAGLTLSPVVFCQEGQFGEGMARLAPDHGQTILGLPKNLFRYQHVAEYDVAAPLYELEDTDVIIIGRGFDSTELAVTWSFFDDGELMATNGMDPYLGPNFAHDPESVAEYEQQLLDHEAAGYQIATISEYVAYVKAQGFPQPPLPPVLDGTWQPPSTESIHQWMGRSGLFDGVYQCERDNEILTGHVRTRHQILTAETLLAWARQEALVGDDEYPTGLRECWRPALLGQVTDGSGINPFIGEMDYAREHARLGRDCARTIIADIADRAGSPYLQVDNETGAVTTLDASPENPATPADPQLTAADGFTVDAPARDVVTTWEAVGPGTNLYRVTLEFTAARNGSRYLEVTFPWELDELRLTPGLVEDEVRTYPLADFDFQEGRIFLPVGNGLIGLRDNLWLIKDTSHVHLAARFEPGDPVVRFIDETPGPDDPVTWVFYLFQGNESEALAQANRLNVRPTIIVVGPTPPADSDSGCGCRTTSTTTALPLLLLLLLALLLLHRRRRRRRR
ncbi:MAG: MYXO-CTERM sorting domain-containing protein [bacterium]